jgi:hypothetical protein
MDDFTMVQHHGLIADGQNGSEDAAPTMMAESPSSRVILAMALSSSSTMTGG